MKPVKGQNRDRDFITNIPDTISDGKNFIITDLFSSITSEKGNTLLTSVAGIINGIISTSDSIIVFSIDGLFSEIGIYKDNTYSIILKTKYLSFDINYPITGEYYYNTNKELIIFFISDNDSSKIINIDNLPFDIDSNYELIDSNKIKLLEQFVPFKQPIYRLLGVIDNDGNLPQGVYYIAIQYKLQDGTYTNPTDLSNPIYVINAGDGEDWVNYHPYFEDIHTNKSIQLSLDEIDDLFLEFRINVIHKSNSDITAYASEDYTLSNIPVLNISSLTNYKKINISDVLVKKIIFDYIGTSASIDNRLYLANLKIPNKDKYQKYANNIIIDWVYNTQVSLDGIKGSYKDSLVIYNSKGFTPGEIGAFYIRFINTDSNKSSDVFHIAGRNPKLGETDITTNVDALKIHSNAKVFQLENTCSILDATNGIGEMGYWENENELYPTGELDKDGEFDGTLDYSKVAITGGRNLQGTPVKHHKFPTINYLTTALPTKRIVDSFDNIANADYVKFYNPTSQYDEYHQSAIAIFVNSATQGTFPTSTKWINNTANALSITLNYDLTVIASNITIPTPGSIDLKLNLYKINTDGSLTYIIGDSAYSDSIDTLSLNINSSIVVSIASNEGLYVEGYAASTGDKFTATFSGEVKAGFGLVPEVDGNVFGRILAIKVSNIYIPDYIKLKYNAFEILYAERNVDNMTVLGSSILPEQLNSLSELVYNKFYNFDLLQSKLALNPSHILFDYIFENGLDNTSVNTIINQDVNIINISNYIYPLSGASYVPNSISYSNPSNTYGGEYINLEYDDTKIPKNITDITKRQYLMGTLYSFKTNVYRPFTNQSLVRTGNIIRISDTIDANNFVSSDIIYGGDTYFNLHGITTFGDGRLALAKDFHLVYYLVPEYSINNIGFRTMDNNIYNLFFPKYNLIDNINGLGVTFTGSADVNDISGTNYINIATDEYDSIFTSVVKTLGQYDNVDFRPYDIVEKYDYNKIWNALNNLQSFIIFNPINDFITDFPYTIFRTLPISNENDIINWRNILANEYVISVSDRKEIVNLDTNGKDLLVEHRYGLYVYKFVNQLNIDANVVSALGDSDIFNRKSLEAIPNGKGYVGCQSKFASIQTKFGNIVVDREQGKIFIYSDTINEISKYGMRKFFINNLQYDNSQIVNDAYLFDNEDYVLFDNGARISIGSTSSIDNKIIDNPFGGIGIFAAWDEEYERLVLTKRSAENDSFSIDYYPAIKSWGFLHDYIPTFMFNNRQGLFSIDETSVYKMNDNEPGLFTIVSSGITTTNRVKSYVDIVFTKNDVTNKRFKSILWNSIVTTLSGDVDNTKTINEITIFNKNRHSDKITLTNKTYTSGNVRRTGGLWKFNSFRDRLATKNIEIVNRNSIDELLLKTLTVEQLVTDWFKQSLFIDDYVIIRFSFNNENGNSIKITDIFINSDKMQR